MQPLNCGAKLGLSVLLALAAVSTFAQTRVDAKFNVSPGASVTVANDVGPVVVHAGSGSQVVLSATTHSKQVEVDKSQTGSRIEIRTRYTQPKLPADAARVDYELTVPADCAVTVRSSTGPITVERLRSDVSADGDTANMDLRDLSNGRVHIRTLKGTVNLVNVSNAHVDVNSVSGPVTLNNVLGPQVEVNTTNGKISYSGALSGNGTYEFTTHSGDIEVVLPSSASVDISARSVSGNVQNDFPFQPKAYTTTPLTSGRSFAGTSNSGGSSLQLRSFSGTIRVKKQ